MKKNIVFYLVLVIFLNSQFVEAKKKSSKEKKETTEVVKDTIDLDNLKGYPVAPFKDTLFFIYNRVGSFSAENRASAISDKIKILYKDDFYIPDSLKVNTSDISHDIVYKGDFILMSVIDADAKTANKSIEELTAEQLAKINKAIVFEKENHSSVNLLKRVGYTLLILFVIWFVLYLVNKIFNKFKTFLLENNKAYFTGFKLKNVNVFSPQKQQFFIMKLIGVIRIFVMILIVYLSLPLLFSIFPSTEAYADTLLDWVFTPAKTVLRGFVNFLPNLFSILVIIFIFRYALKVLKFFVDEIKKENIHIDGFYSDWAMPTFNIIKFLMYAFMLVLIFPYLPGSNSPIFRGVSVFVGVLFSLGSSNAIANMVAGLVITYMRPFKIGDFIKIGDVSGEVIEKTALVTRVRTTKFEDITIPNATVLSSTSTNYSANTHQATTGLVVHTTVTIGYDVPWKNVHQALIIAATRTELVEAEPKPFVLQTSLDDFYVAYQINAYTKEPNKQPRIYSSLHQNIQDSFNEAGIEIMSPHYRASRDGSQSTIPENYLKKE